MKTKEHFCVLFGLKSSHVKGATYILFIILSWVPVSFPSSRAYVWDLFFPALFDIFWATELPSWSHTSSCYVEGWGWVAGTLRIHMEPLQRGKWSGDPNVGNGFLFHQDSSKLGWAKWGCGLAGSWCLISNELGTPSFLS